jgi:hypothetical protein
VPAHCRRPPRDRGRPLRGGAWGAAARWGTGEAAAVCRSCAVAWSAGAASSAPGARLLGEGGGGGSAESQTSSPSMGTKSSSRRLASAVRPE